MLIMNQLSVEPQPSTSRDIPNPGFSKLWFCAGKNIFHVILKPLGL